MVSYYFLVTVRACQCSFPESNGFLDIAGMIIDITGMFQQYCRRVGVVLQGLINIDTSFTIPFLHKEYPCIGIEISGILRFCLDGTEGHLLCLVQLYPFHTQVVGIVVQAPNIVFLPLETRVIGCESLTVHSLLMHDITHDSIEITVSPITA